MSAFDDGVRVLKIAAERGNGPSKAILAELEFRDTRIKALHEINTELNTQLRDLRLKMLQQAPGFNGDFTPGVTKAATVKQGAE